VEWQHQCFGTVLYSTAACLGAQINEWATIPPRVTTMEAVWPPWRCVCCMSSVVPDMMGGLLRGDIVLSAQQSQAPRKPHCPHRTPGRHRDRTPPQRRPGECNAMQANAMGQLSGMRRRGDRCRNAQAYHRRRAASSHTC
jgi:hypothetical protein